MADNIARMEEGKRAFRILTGKPKVKIPLGRPGRRWEDLKRIGIIREIGLIRLRIGIIGEPW